MPFQSDKQKRWMYANEPEIAREWSDRYGAANGGIMDVASDGNLRHDFANFTNGNNINVPSSFQARAGSEPVDLAYVTPQEQGILQTLKPGTPHEGPMGIPNYDSFDAAGNYTSGTAMSAAETGSRNAADRREVRASNIGGPKGLAPGVTSKEAEALRASFINAGAGQRVNPGFFDSRTRLSPYERALAKAYRQDPNNRFAKKAYRKSGQGGIMDFLTSGGFWGNLLRGVGQKFGLGKRWNEPTHDMSEFNKLTLGGRDPFANLDIRDKWDRRKTQEEDINIEDTHDFEGVDFDNIAMQNYLQDQSNFTQPNTSSFNIGEEFLSENPEVRSQLSSNFPSNDGIMGIDNERFISDIDPQYQQHAQKIC